MIHTIIDWCNMNSGFLMVAITLVYVAATCLICYYNKKSANAAVEQAEQAQKMMQKSIDIQLYDKMLAISNNIEIDDYSNTAMEISVLFGNQIWKQVKSLKEKVSELQEWKRKQELYNQLCEEQGYDDNLAFEAGMEGAPEEIIREAMAQEEQFAVVYDYEMCNPEYEIEAEKYDRREISSKIETLKVDISKGQKQLKRDVYSILKSKITLG